VHPPDRIKKNKKFEKEHYIEDKTSSFYSTQQSGDVSPTPSTCQVEGIFGWG
jgi:hypothetical protein